MIANYNLTAVWLATLDPNIKSVKDLAGKKIGLGRVTQINWAIQPEWVLKYGYDLPKGKVDIQYIGTKEAVDAYVSIRPGQDRSETDRQNLQNFGQALADVQDLPEAIQTAKDALGLGSQGGNAFSTDVLRLEIMVYSRSSNNTCCVFVDTTPPGAGPPAGTRRTARLRTAHG